MTIKIYEGDNEKTILLCCDDPRFVREFGNSKIECNTKGLYQNLHLFCSWTTNALRENCYFELV